MPDQRRQFVETEHVRAVAEGPVGLGMRLEKYAIATAGDCGPGQKRNHLPLSACGVASRQLHTVRRVEDHRRSQILHCGNCPHVVDQPAVAKRRAPFGQQYPRIAECFAFADDVHHVFGGRELRLLDVDRPAVFGGRFGHRLDEVGLASQKRRDLQDVADSGSRRGLIPLVNVGQKGKPRGSFDLRQNLEPRCEARPAETVDAGAIGLIEARFEHELQVEPIGQIGQAAAHFEDQPFRLDHAGPGNEQQRLSLPAFVGSDSDRVIWHVHSCFQ